MYVVRPASRKDRKSIKRLNFKASVEEKIWFMPNKLRFHWQQYVVVDDDKIIGNFIITFNFNKYYDGTLAALYLLPEHRHKGILKNVIVPYITTHFPEYTIIVAAHRRNAVANIVYNKLFKFYGDDKKLTWFYVTDTREGEEENV